MQNKILIIGNGFDLYHKLPTGYKDFLFFAKNWKIFKDEYSKHVSSAASKTAEMIDVRLGERNELILESLMDLAVYANIYSKEHIAYIDTNLQNNAWLTYFDKVMPLGQNWIDFEAEIERALRQVEMYYDRVLPSVVSGVPVNKMPELMTKVIYTFSEKAEKTEKDYVNLAKNSFRAEKDTDPEKLHPNKIKLLSSMKHELDVLNKCLNYYLLEFVSAINCGVYSEQIQTVSHNCIFNRTG